MKRLKISMGELRSELRKYGKFCLMKRDPRQAELSVSYYSSASVCMQPTFISLGVKPNGTFIGGIRGVYVVKKEANSIQFYINSTYYATSGEINIDYILKCVA